MNFNSPIPFQLRPKFSEGSALASERDSRSNAQAWKKARSISRQENSNGLAIQKITREVSKMRRRIVGGGSVQSDSSIAIYKITTIPVGNKDYFLAKTWDGTNLGTEEVAISKQRIHRPSITEVTILGDVVTLTYSDDNHRTTSDGVNPDQSEELWNTFEVDGGLTGGIISAIEPSNGTGVFDDDGNEVLWLDDETRVWGKYA